MKKKIKEDPLKFISTEHGILTFEEIKKLGHHYAVYDCLLKDGDTVALTEEIATGILLIRDKLNPQNKAKMDKMDVLELLNIYDRAILDGVLTPSRLLTTYKH